MERHQDISTSREENYVIYCIGIQPLYRNSGFLWLLVLGEQRVRVRVCVFTLAVRVEGLPGVPLQGLSVLWQQLLGRGLGG